MNSPPLSSTDQHIHKKKCQTFEDIIERQRKLDSLMDESRCLQVSSEIYTETKFRTSKTNKGTTISQFTFCYPSDNDDPNNCPIIDKDGDLEVERRRHGVIQIEHQHSTNLSLVGLQVWRGAFMLADFLFHNRHRFQNKRILELGSGVGLTSIAAAIHSKTDIYCTDIDIGGILNLVKSNITLNECLLNKDAKIHVMELNFKNIDWSSDLQKSVSQSNIIIAADVIYDNDITDYFINTLQRLLDTESSNVDKSKEIYIALEKRYVFTLADLDTLAPCYEYFLQRLDEVRKTTHWRFETVDIDFPQYFDYERSKDLILFKLSV